MDREVIFHSENGVLGMGPAPEKDKIEPWLINAGKQYVTLRAGGSFCHHADSFSMIRGGHLDLCVLGAFQVADNGDIANWATSENDTAPAVGGAMDLAAGAKRLWVLMEHTTKDGTPKLVTKCTYPLTAPGCRQARLYQSGDDRRDRPRLRRAGHGARADVREPAGPHRCEVAPTRLTILRRVGLDHSKRSDRLLRYRRWRQSRQQRGGLSAPAPDAPMSAQYRSREPARTHATCARGCGRIGSGAERTIPSMSIISRSRVRAAFASPRCRPHAVSIAMRSASSAAGSIVTPGATSNDATPLT